MPQTKEEKLDVKAVLLSGALLGLSYPPFPFFFFAFFAFVPYFRVLEKREGFAAINRITYLWAFVFNLITLYWVGSWTKEADPFLMISGVALLFFNPLLFLIPSSLYAWAKKNNVKYALYLFPFFFVTYEFLYSVTEFRFPWLTLGNSQAYFTLFIQAADIIGVYGISLSVLFINIFLYLYLKKIFTERKIVFSRELVFAFFLFFVPLFYGAFFVGKNFSNKKITVGVIQPNLNPWKKWSAGSLDEQMNLYFDMSREAIRKGARLLIFPETALPVYITSPSYKKELRRIFDFVDSTGVPILTGMPDLNIFPASRAPEDAKSFRNGDRKYTTYNAVYLFVPHTRLIQEYHKTKLVPFGEKIPYAEYLPFLGKLLKWGVGISSWNTGDGARVFYVTIDYKNVVIGPVICIESIYPEYVTEFTRFGAQLLVVVTNDSWYGKSSGPYQHEAIAILRAVENRRYVVRAANGGISCIISPRGKITAETELFTRDVLVSEVGLNERLTWYAKHPYIVPYFSVFVTVFVTGLSIIFFMIKREMKKT